MKNELILAFDSVAVNDLYQEGITSDFNIDDLNQSVIIQPRHMAEKSKTTRHPIPYTVLFDGCTREILLYRRGAKVGESRLSGNASCGFGGHVDVDADLISHCIGDDNVFSAAKAVSYTADKELMEELGVDLSDDKTEIVGILRDDSNEVGKVHLGVIMVKFVDRDQFTETNEEELNFIGWVKIDDIKIDDSLLNLENWSKLTIQHLQANL